MAETEAEATREEGLQVDFYARSMYPSAEFLHLLLHAQAHDETLAHFLHGFGTCHPATLENMLHRLLNNAVHDQERLHCIISIQHLQTEGPPSIPLFYAPHCVSTLMQDIGHMRQGWRLNMSACKVGATFNPWSPLELGVNDGEEFSHLHRTIISCYVRDTTLSANLYQPACLGNLGLVSATLNNHNPSDALLGVRLSYAQVHEAIILSGFKLRNRHTLMSKDWLRFEWLNLDFIFHSTMTSIIRLGSWAEESQPYQECLDTTRNSLLSLITLLDIFSEAGGANGYLSILARTIPLFALRPLYFCFRHLVETSDAVDLKILQDIAKALKLPAQLHCLIREIEQLCHSFIKLYIDFKEAPHAIKPSRPPVRVLPPAEPTRYDRRWTSESQPLDEPAGAQVDLDLALLDGIGTPQGNMDWLNFYQEPDWELWVSQDLSTELSCSL
ncbi:hypothetical protein BJX66DRAFT_344552 [Aspergillus keveii]|uniref:C6 transcription factor n=1 Tax=Aspergillus keveii TaxID=714993 RepID=A0ABR4FKY0_9EURO